MKITIYLFICLFTYLSVSLNGQVINSQEKEKNEGIQRNATYNLEEIKVRWKKAALENCIGAPCIIIPPPPSFTCGTSTISDIDNYSYNTVLIGTQCWTKENLKVTKYNDGTGIPLNNTYTSGTVSTVWAGLTTGAYTIYGNESSTGANATNYGFLYNWYAAAGIITNGGSPTKNICPTGWHVPTDTEWTTLTTSLGGESVAGTLMKKNDALWSTNTGTNTSGFSALPGGERGSNGTFFAILSYAIFWSATQDNINDGWYRSINDSNINVDRSSYNGKQLGRSVRCLRD
jgi:uncharacterized protein (TIGR02145 family)